MRYLTGPRVPLAAERQRRGFFLASHTDCTKYTVYKGEHTMVKYNEEHEPTEEEQQAWAEYALWYVVVFCVVTMFVFMDK